jgi:hypothetical protein
MYRSSIAALSLLAFLCLPAAASNDEAVAKARTAAQAWLSLADAGDGAGTWQSAAAIFQGAVTKDSWQRALSGVRGPLGAVKGRTFKSATFTKSLPGAPDGEYVVIQYATQFANKADSTETVTPMKEKDGSWKVSGYYIK